jgi:hypothetical protein
LPPALLYDVRRAPTDSGGLVAAAVHYDAEIALGHEYP